MAPLVPKGEKSVYDEPTALAQALDAGAAGFVLKRTAATDLIDAVDAASEGRSTCRRRRADGAGMV
jgi:DNA-binding NarL/FixJ family response regulator